MRQQWIFPRGYDNLNAVEHIAVSVDRAHGFMRNPIDTPLNRYERDLYADAFCTILSARIDRLLRGGGR